MVATEHERQLAGLAARGHVVGDLAADGQDLVEVLGASVADGECLDRILGHRAQVAHAHSQLAESPDEVRVTNRGGPHVDTAAALAEVERGSEHRDTRKRRRAAHAATSALSTSGASWATSAGGPASTPAGRPPDAGSASTRPPASLTIRSPAAWSHSLRPCS